MLKNKYTHTSFVHKGFSLIEMIVSLSIFVAVMVLVMGAVLSVLDINRKAQTEKTAMDNINFALDSLSRTVRFSTSYHCGSTGTLTQPLDCQSGGSSLTVLGPDGKVVSYSLGSGALLRSIAGSAPVALTSSEINITSVVFRVFGSYPYGTDYQQPQVIVTIFGLAGNPNKPKNQTAFQLETTISQRKLDI